MAGKVETNIKTAARKLGAQYIDISWTKEKDDVYDSLRESHFDKPTVDEDARAILGEALQIYKAKTGKDAEMLPGSPKRQRSYNTQEKMDAEEEDLGEGGMDAEEEDSGEGEMDAEEEDSGEGEMDAEEMGGAAGGEGGVPPAGGSGLRKPLQFITPIDYLGKRAAYSQNPKGRPALEDPSAFGTIVNLKTIKEYFGDILNGWVTGTNLNRDISKGKPTPPPRPNKDTINIEYVPTFNRCLRGPGGAIYILRYIQFLDMVHDMCHARGEESNAWVKKGTDGKNSKAIFKNIVDMYVKDIIWLKNKGIVPYISSDLDTEEQKTEYALFFSHICIKPKKIKAEFYNLSITFNNYGNPEYNPKDKDYVPHDKNTTLRIQYLLLIYMKIAPAPSSSFLEGGSSCSDFLFTNAEYILNQKNASRSITDRVLKLLPYYKTQDAKIILHVDAESNKTGLCNIIPKICDYAFSVNKTVEYTKYFSSKEYDAALVQSSEKYIDLLSRSRSTQVNTKDSKTPTKYDLDLKYEDISLMSLTYTRYENKSFYIQILRILNYTTKNEIYLDWNNKKIDRNSLLYFNYLYNNFKHLDKSTSKKELVNLTFEKCQLLDVNLKRTSIKLDAKQGQQLKNFTNFYGIVLKETRDIIKLTINKAYSLENKQQFANTYKMGAYNPFAKPPQQGTAAAEAAVYNQLSYNENLSITSSVRAITHGEHYDDKFMLKKSYSMTKPTGNKNRIWLKHLGDFGQALEFCAYTKNKFDEGTIPIFLSFDKISVYLSSLFNPMTALDDLDSDSYTKIQFYAKHRAVDPKEGMVRTSNPFTLPSTYNDEDEFDFGKVNKRNIKQKNISKRLKFMSDLDIKNKLKSVGIKITKTIRGKRKYLSRKELENKAKLFNKIQNTARRMKIKIMYKKNRIYKYKTYKRLQKEIKKMKNKPRNKKMYNSRVKNFNFG